MSSELARYFCLILILALPASTGSAQTGDQKPNKVDSLSTCRFDRALDLIDQQIAASRLIDDSVKRIAVLVRAADLLWLQRQKRSRAAFTEAFDLATDDFKQKGNEPRRAGVGLIIQVPDQRYTVISAIAKRDPAWARKLSNEMLKDEAKEAEEKVKDPRQEATTAEKLLLVAKSLLPSDPSAALSFARISLQYPATLQLPVFVYSLATSNKTASDAFYQEALAAYANSPMDQFLYLSSYPFGNSREAGEMSSWTYYQVPDAFTPNPSLQRLFMQVLIRRTQQFLEALNYPQASTRYSEGEQMWIALTRLQPQVSQSLPELVGAVQQARGSMFAVLNQQEQSRAADIVTERPKRSFDQLVADADRERNSDTRERMIALAILGARHEPLEKLIDAASKIDDLALRDKILNWVYFERAQTALRDNKLDEAQKLAAEVRELDERTYLYSRVAEASLRSLKDDQVARELLEEVISGAEKAPDSEVKVRALLGASYLYLRIEPNRSMATLADAVKSINHIDSPDFSHDYVRRKIEGRSFGSYATLQTPGFNPQNGFREIGKADFDGALSLAVTISDKALRAMVTMALAEGCLQNSPKPQK